MIVSFLRSNSLGEISLFGAEQLFQGATQGFSPPLVTDPKVFNPTGSASTVIRNQGNLLANLPNITSSLVQGVGQQLFQRAGGFNPQGLATAAVCNTQTLAAPGTRQALTQQIVQNCRGGFCPPGIGEPFEFPTANLPVTPQTQPVAGQTPNPDAYVALIQTICFCKKSIGLGDRFCPSTQQ
jgi:hypothetical protein